MNKLLTIAMFAIMATVSHAQSLEKMNWFNEPASYEIKGKTLTMDVPGHCDYWRISHYGFTVDNCKRPHDQFVAFQKACVEAVQFLTTEGADLLVIGNTESKCFPEELKKYTTRTSVNGGGIKLNFLVNYGWKWDLSHILQDGLPYSSDISRIDMIVRWGGMRRLSGFLPIQSVYADFYVEDKLWPDYENADFRKAMAWYENQDDTFGG